MSLPFMCRLRVLEIYHVLSSSSDVMNDLDILSTLIRSLLLSLTSLATLEHIKFNIVYDGYNNNLDHDWFCDTLPDADIWSHLDSIITHPTGSRLQRVDINIEYVCRYNGDVMELDNTKVSESVHDS